jgi:iron complex outermembrane receptor protein
MSLKTVSAHQKTNERLRRGQAPFRLNPIATVVACMAILASGSSYAADPTVAELQAEIVQLKQIIAAQNAASGNAPAQVDADVKKDAAALAIPAQAEPATLGEVTVSSAPPIEILHDVPLSVSVVSGTELNQTAAASIAAITERLANVTFNQGNQQTSSISIRGIGKIGQTQAQDPSVGVTVDGVSYGFNPLVSAYDFVDVDTASVIRGPQGTEGGKNTSVGVVNITTNRPSFTPSADYSLAFGQQGTFIGRLAAGGSVIDDLLAWRGTFVVDRGDGNMLNLYNNDTTYINTDRVSGHVQFLFTPTTDFSARFSANLQPNTNETYNSGVINTPTPNHYANGALNPLTTDAATRLGRSWFTNESSYSYAGDFLYGAGQNAVDLNAQQGLQTHSSGASLELDWDLGKHTLTSLTAMQDYYFDAVNDEGTPFDVEQNSGGNQEYFRQISQELKIASKPGGFVDYQTGIYLLKDSNNVAQNKIFGSDGVAWFASPAQYTILDATAAGQLLMENSMDRLSAGATTGPSYQDVQNKSEAI